VEKNIAAQPKSVVQPIGRYLPTCCNTRFYVQIVVQLDEAVEKAIHRPNVVLGARESRVERGDGVVLVVAESLARLVGARRLAAGQKQGKRKR
jgi:hypothetical protein